MTLNRRKSLLLLTAFFFIAILYRGIALLTPVLWRDEGTVGISGLRVLQGDFPIFFYGQSFMGTLEGYMYGLLFFLFNASPLVMELFPVVLSLVFFILNYLLVKRIFGIKIALWTSFLLAIPNFYYLSWTHEARPHYAYTLVFGNILLLLAHKILYPRPSPKDNTFLFIALGLMAGLAWWVNYLTVAYILPVALFIFLKEKTIVIKAKFPLTMLSFAVGSLPLWVFCLKKHHSILGIGNFSSADLYLKGKALFLNAFPILLGFDPTLFSSDRWELSGAIFAGALLGASLLTFILAHRSGLFSILKLRLPGQEGGELILFVFGTGILLNIFTGYGQLCLPSPDQRFLLPLYSGIFLLLGFFLSKIYLSGRIITILILVPLLFFNILGNLNHTVYLYSNGWIFLNRTAYQSYRQNELREAQLIDSLKRMGLQRLYADDVLGKVLMIKSREALIFSNPFQEDFLKYAQMVDGSSRAAYLVGGDNTFFEENLRAIGGGYRKSTLPGGYQIFSEFQSPPDRWIEIPRDQWKGSASENASQAPWAFDNDITTEWRAPITPGSYYLLDLGKSERLGKVEYIPSSYREVPSGFRLEASPDGRTWKVLRQVNQYQGPFFWSEAHPMIKLRRGRVEMVFDPLWARYLKITLLGPKEEREWSINELFIYRPEPGQTGLPTPKEIAEVIHFLRENKIKWAYTDHWLSAVIQLKKDSPLATIPSNHYLDEYGERNPEPTLFPAARFTPETAFIIRGQGQDDLEEKISTHPVYFSKKKIGPYWVYYNFLVKRPNTIPTAGWQVSANRNPSETALAIDGNIRTRWTSKQPQEPGLTYQLDLGQVRQVRGISLRLGTSVNDYPRELTIWTSLDGRTWQEAHARWASDYYWSGTHLIRTRGTEDRYTFPAVDLRYITLRQEGLDRNYYWSIHELEVWPAEE